MISLSRHHYNLLPRCQTALRTVPTCHCLRTAFGSCARCHRDCKFKAQAWSRTSLYAHWWGISSQMALGKVWSITTDSYWLRLASWLQANLRPSIANLKRLQSSFIKITRKAIFTHLKLLRLTFCISCTKPSLMFLLCSNLSHSRTISARLARYLLITYEGQSKD